MVAANPTISPIRLFPVGEIAAPKTGVAKDAFGRAMTYLRISLTDRCNFRCFYCMPALGMKFQPKKEHLTDDELLRRTNRERKQVGADGPIDPAAD